MKRINFKLLGIIAGLLLCSSGAWAYGDHMGPNLGLVGVGDFYDFNGTTGTIGTVNGNFSTKMGFGGGAVIGLPLGGMLELELGALYVQRKNTFTATSGGTGTLDETFTTLQIPVLLRYWFNRYLSLGLGGYYAMAIGTIGETGTGSFASGNVSYSSAGINTSDYGLTGSLGINIPISSSISFLADGRYNWGFKGAVQNALSNSMTREIQALAGLRFGFGSGRGY